MARDAAEISKEKLKKIKEHIIKGDIADYICDYKAHVVQRHCALTEAESLDRVMSEFVPKQGFFANEGEEKEAYAKRLIGEAMLYYEKDIMQWLSDRTIENHKRYENAMPVERDDYFGDIGAVFVKEKHTEKIKEYEPNSIRFILERDDSFQIGFTLITAYPEINQKFNKSPEIIRDLTSITKQTETYKKASHKLKAALLWRANPENKCAVGYYKTKSGKEHLFFDVKDSPGIYRIFIDEETNKIVKQASSKFGAKWIESTYAEIYRNATNRPQTKIADLKNTAVAKHFAEHMPDWIQDTTERLTEMLHSFSSLEKDKKDFKDIEEDIDIGED